MSPDHNIMLVAPEVSQILVPIPPHPASTLPLGRAGAWRGAIVTPLPVRMAGKFRCILVPLALAKVSFAMMG